MISIVIVEDEPLPATRLRRLLELEPDVRIAGEAEDGAEALLLLRRERPDAVFLDIHLPDMSGFDVLGQLDPRHWPLVVFVTAYDQFAVRAFDIHALHYLLKPFDDARVRSVQHDASGDLEIVLASGTRLRVGRAYRVRLAERWEGFPGGSAAG